MSLTILGIAIDIYQQHFQARKKVSAFNKALINKRHSSGIYDYVNGTEA
jgi:hypothetical protein